MEQRQDIRKEVDLTLESLDGMTRAEASPFFFTRLMARMEAEPLNPWTRAMLFLAKPAVSLSLLFFFLLFNGFLILSSLQEQEEAGTQDYVAQQISYFDNLTSPLP